MPGIEPNTSRTLYTHFTYLPIYLNTLTELVEPVVKTCSATVSNQFRYNNNILYVGYITNWTILASSFMHITEALLISACFLLGGQVAVKLTTVGAGAWMVQFVCIIITARTGPFSLPPSCSLQKHY